MVRHLHRWRIDMPEESKVAEYLELGWIKIKDLQGEGLRWSFARGTPRFPGDEAPEPPPEPQKYLH
jgi:hypothetical protein